MQLQNKRNSQFMIAKEIFINHINGQIEEDYDLNSKCLGEGGFGKVFEGKKKKFSIPYNTKDPLTESFSSFQTSSRCGSQQMWASQQRAIKRISYKRPEDKELMQNEIQILSYLDHPLIVRLYETYEHKKNLYLVIDLMKGGDLFTVITQNSKLSQYQTRLIFTQIIKALSYLHSQHICHRDLKLENILFLNKDDFNIKLVDFGLAFCWDENMKTQLKQKGLHKKMTGTPDYMAPEMLNQNYDQRCDIWSAGVILYMLLTGVAPFQGETQKDIIKRIKNLDYTLDIAQFNGISQQAKDLIFKILQPENERISLQQILQHPWIKHGQLFLRAENISQNTTSLKDDKHLRKRDNILKRKQKTIRQFQKMKRKSSQTYSDQSQDQSKCRSYCSQDFSHDYLPWRLTVAKMQHFSRLTKLQKFQAIYAVSKLSESKLKNYGLEFLFIDKNNNGTICLQDLSLYLKEQQEFEQTQKIEFYFNQLILSNRGYIGYSEYLACVLAYQADYKISFSDEILQFDERFISNDKAQLLSVCDNKIIENINILDDQIIYQLFDFLNEDKDQFISVKNFYNILQKNGIQKQNQGFIEELTEKFHKMSKDKKTQSQEKQNKEVWFIDPRTYKWQLSRTYKGESDGGTCIDYKQFKYLIQQRQVSLK